MTILLITDTHTHVRSFYNAGKWIQKDGVYIKRRLQLIELLKLIKARWWAALFSLEMRCVQTTQKIRVVIQLHKVFAAVQFQSLFLYFSQARPLNINVLITVRSNCWPEGPLLLTCQPGPLQEMFNAGGSSCYTLTGAHKWKGHALWVGGKYPWVSKEREGTSPGTAQRDVSQGQGIQTAEALDCYSPDLRGQ